MPHVRDLLESHESELVSQLKILREAMIPLERELADVRRARAAVAAAAQGPEQSQIEFPDVDLRGNLKTSSRYARVFAYGTIPERDSPYNNLTIKDLVRKALLEQFEFGATANELLDFFTHAWGRNDLVRTSLSPQLSRLKQEGEIVLDGQKWKLPASQRRQNSIEGS